MEKNPLQNKVKFGYPVETLKKMLLQEKTKENATALRFALHEIHQLKRLPRFAWGKIIQEDGSLSESRWFVVDKEGNYFNLSDAFLGNSIPKSSIKEVPLN